MSPRSFFAETEWICPHHGVQGPVLYDWIKLGVRAVTNPGLVIKGPIERDAGNERMAGDPAQCSVWQFDDFGIDQRERAMKLSARLSDDGTERGQRLAIDRLHDEPGPSGGSRHPSLRQRVEFGDRRKRSVTLCECRPADSQHQQCCNQTANDYSRSTHQC